MTPDPKAPGISPPLDETSLLFSRVWLDLDRFLDPASISSCLTDNDWGLCLLMTPEECFAAATNPENWEIPFIWSLGWLRLQRLMLLASS